MTKTEQTLIIVIDMTPISKQGRDEIEAQVRDLQELVTTMGREMVVTRELKTTQRNMMPVEIPWVDK